MRSVRLRAVGIATACASIFVLSGCSTQMPEAHRDDVIGTWSHSTAESTVWGPDAEIELHSDNSVVVKDFPLDALSESDLYHVPISGAGTWEFIPQLPAGEAMYEDQSGIEVVLPSPGSTGGTKVLRRLVIEKKDDIRLRLVIYVGFPHLLDKNYVLTKRQ